MKKFQFLDKRDSNGLLLGYSITEFSYNLAEQCLSKIKTYDTYQHLINFLPKKYVDIYFKKLFYEATLPLAGQVAINNWHLDPSRIKKGKKLKSVFEYSSNKNSKWLTIKEIKNWISKYLKRVNEI